MTASVTSNPLLKYGALAVVVIAALVIVNGLGGNSDDAHEQVEAESGKAKPIQINPNETRLGAEADNTETSIETLAGSMAELRAKITRLESGTTSSDSSVMRAQQQREAEQRQSQLEALEREIKDLRAALNDKSRNGGDVALPEPGGESVVNSQEPELQVNGNQADLQKTLDAQVSNQQQDFGLQEGETPAKQGFTLPDIPQLNIPGREVPQRNNATQSGSRVKSEMDGDIEWINPADARMVVDEQSKKEVVTLPEFKGSEYSRPVKTTSNTVVVTGESQEGEKENSLVPVYTIPSGSSLLKVTAATALIGRIPMNNAITSPYPFKIVVGAKNLATNGISIPNLKGMVINGTATGDYTLQCVNGQINSITYTFMDGTIRTVTGSGSNGGSNNGGSGSGANAQQSLTGNTGGLGYIADSQGVPCVSGKLISNIDEYLTQTMAINGLAGAADAFAEGQASVTTNTDGSSNSVIAGGSSTMSYMAGKGLGTGIQSGADVLTARQQGAYDAVYVGPGALLEIHITQQIEIDYDKKGRKVSHVQTVSRYSSNRGLD